MIVAALHDCALCVPVEWGEEWEVGSAAFWVGVARAEQARSFALGRTLREEVVVCMLGGWRVAGPVGVAAFEALRRSGVLDGSAPSEEAVETALSEVLTSDGRVLGRYPFPAQRGRRIAAALAAFDADGLGWLLPDGDHRSLRDRLCGLPGVGPKTASWVVRNHLACDDVAIIDVHVQRAGLSAGLFCPSWRLPRDYGLFETAFGRWASRGGVRASVLDTAVWAALAGGRQSVLAAPPPAVRTSEQRWLEARASPGLSDRQVRLAG